MEIRSRSAVPIIVGGVIVVALLAWFLRRPQSPFDRHAAEDTIAAVPPQPASEPERDALPPPLGPAVEAPPPAVSETSPDDSGGADEIDSGGEDMYDDPMAQAWSTVDLDEVRRAMPDNLYFKLSVPTKDEAVLEERAAERARWNVEYGKVLSGTGTEEEIRAYYDQRARLSGDYVEFTTYLLDRYRDTLPERDIGLLELARRLHLARLEEIPRQVEEAGERKRKQDEARAAWLADQAEFERAQGEAAASEE